MTASTDPARAPNVIGDGALPKAPQAAKAFSGAREPSALPQRLGAVVIVSLAAFRATVSPESLPWFDTDPFSPLTAPMTGPGPAGMLLMDVITMLAAAVIFGAEAWRGRQVGLLSVAALLAGAAAVLWHGLGGPAIDDLRLGATWIAAFAGALALTCAARDPATRRIAFGIAIGVIALLAARGVMEYTLEHDRTIANFEANRQAIFESRGWSDDSTMARAFERRLRQREASAWFGLTNVYATFVAGAFVALVALAGAGWRQARSQRPALADGWPGVLTIGAIAAAVALWMSHSRGGMLAAAIGLGMLALGALARRRTRLASWTAPAAIAVVPLMMGLIAVQGALGTRFGDLSLLFRWFYVKTAGVIFGQEPLVGVGPAGFQAAYQLHKPPVSPEDVSSPHNVLLTLLATLGAGGAAWAALWLMWLWRSGRLLGMAEHGPEPDPADPAPGRPELWLVIGACSVPTLLGAWLEQPAMTPEAALVRILGLIGWVGIAWGVIVVARSAGSLSLAAGAAAVAVAAQSLLDMGGTFQTSACLVLSLIGLAAVAPGRAAAPAGRFAQRGMGLVAPAAAGLLGAAVLVGGLIPVWRWERAMISAGRQAYVAAEMTRRVNNALSPEPIEPAMVVLRDLASAVGQPPAQGPQDLEHQLTLLHLAQAERAVERLGEAGRALSRPHFPTQRALSQTLMTIADARQRLGEREAAVLAATESERAALVGARAADTASAWSWLAVIRDHMADLLGDPAPRTRAIEALQRATDLNPHSAALAYRLFVALDAARREAEASEWARRTLRLDELASLDPEGAGLTDSQRERARRGAGPP